MQFLEECTKAPAPKNVYTFEEYFNAHVKNSEDYLSKQQAVLSKYNKIVNEDIDEFIRKVSALKELKQYLQENITLPEKYSDEKLVDALLALVLDKRADTLKEAINLFETELYQNAVVNSLDSLNNNIISLNKNILSLRNEINQINSGINRLMQQNNYISNRLDAINFDTTYLMIDNLLS